MNEFARFKEWAGSWKAYTFAERVAIAYYIETGVKRPAYPKLRK